MYCPLYSCLLGARAVYCYYKKEINPLSIIDRPFNEKETHNTHLYYSGNIVNKILFSWLIRPGHGGGSYSGVYSGVGSILRGFYFSASTLLLFSGPGFPWLYCRTYKGSASCYGPRNPRIQEKVLHGPLLPLVWSSPGSCSPHKGGAPASRPGSPSSIWR
jgi:hypothetical protein